MDGTVKEREAKAPGYVDGVYIVGWAITGGVNRDGAADPQATRKRASGDKVAIPCKYCSNQMDLSNRTFREALHQIRHYVNECWITRFTTTTSRPCCGRRQIIIW